MKKTKNKGGFAQALSMFREMVVIPPVGYDQHGNLLTSNKMLNENTESSTHHIVPASPYSYSTNLNGSGE